MIGIDTEDGLVFTCSGMYGEAHFGFEWAWKWPRVGKGYLLCPGWNVEAGPFRVGCVRFFWPTFWHSDKPISLSAFDDCPWDTTYIGEYKE